MIDVEVRELDDLSWCLVKNKNDVDVDAFLKGNEDASSFVVITCGTKKTKDVSRIDVYTSRTISLKEILEEKLEKENIILKENISGHEYTSLLSIKTKDSLEQAKKYLSKIFSSLLITGRPLRYYNCTFYLPLDLVLDNEINMRANRPNIKVKKEGIKRYKIKDPEQFQKSIDKDISELTPEEQEDLAQVQSYKFFHSQIKDQLFETESDHKNLSNAKPIKQHQLKLQKYQQKQLILRDDETEGSTASIKAEIKDISLYEYYNGLFVLAIQVGLPVFSPHISNYMSDEKNWWEALVFCGSDDWSNYQLLQVENWLRYSKTVRNLYAGFFEQLIEKKIAPVELVLQENDKKNLENNPKSNVQESFSSVIIHLIQLFLEVEKKELTIDSRLRQIADERMFIHASYVLAGTQPVVNSTTEAEFDRLFSYALYVDQRTDGYDAANKWAYDESFTKKLMEPNISRRWQSIGHLKGFTDYSTIVLGFGWFLQNPVATVHMPYQYGKIQILILFYRLTLEHFDRRITIATKQQMEKGVQSKAFKELRRSLINFTNKYWFRDLTAQIQGKEIVRLMSKQQELDEKYDLIKDKLDRASDYSTVLKDFWLQEKAVLVGWIAVFFAILTFIPNIIGPWFLSAKINILKQNFPNLNCWIVSDLDSTGYKLVLLIIIAMIIGYGFLKIIKKIFSYIKKQWVKDECN